MFLTYALTKDPLILKPLLVACLGGFLMAQLLHRQSLFERLIPPLTPKPPKSPP